MAGSADAVVLILATGNAGAVVPGTMSVWTATAEGKGWRRRQPHRGRQNGNSEESGKKNLHKYLQSRAIVMNGRRLYHERRAGGCALRLTGVLSAAYAP